jgi:hypothetical protein
MKNYFKRLLFRDSNKGKKFVFTSRNLGYQTGNGERIRSNEGNNGSMSINSGVTSSGYTIISDYISTTDPSGSPVGITLPSSPNKKMDIKVDERKEVKPVEVFNEIKKEGLEPDFSNLDIKIKAVEDRIKVLKEHLDDEHLVDEHKALFFLKNRRKYLDTKKKYPIDWAMTNRDAVDDLCKRYKLQVVPLKQYYTLVPNEGIKEMSRFTKAYVAVTGDKPIFELIIKEKESVPEEQKKRVRKDRDPILVANSPFGNFMFVLGAWDDEVEFVDEIIYDGK